MSESALDRFRKRQNRDMVLHVPWPETEPLLTFHINRFSQVEFTAASHTAEKALRERGIRSGDPEWAEEYKYSFMYALADHIKRNLKGWEHHAAEGEEKLQYNQANVEGLFREMSSVDRLMLGAAYMNKIGESEKNAQAPETTDGAS